MKRFIHPIPDKFIEKQVNTIFDNLNEPEGYRAYYELEKYILDNNLDDGVLYDMASEFRWDDKLEKALNELAESEGRYDLVNIIYE